MIHSLAIQLIRTGLTLTALLSAPAQAQSPGQMIPNPFCSAPAFAVPFESRNAGINATPRGVVITISSQLAGNAHLRNALLAHECAHVRNGDWHPPRSAAEVHDRELAADCFAARALATRGDANAIRAMTAFVGSCGGMPSGHPMYPTCQQRRDVILRCANQAR